MQETVYFLTYITDIYDLPITWETKESIRVAGNIGSAKRVYLILLQLKYYRIGDPLPGIN